MGYHWRAHMFVVVATVAAGCASYPPAARLKAYALRDGYRFEQLPTTGRNSEELFVVLALSGGGTRAAALSYGVLTQLAAVKFRWDAARGQPVPCTPDDTTGCALEERSLLDEVDVISSVSGGSFTAAFYALQRERIFDRTGPFHTNFLYHPVQGDLLSQAFYSPANWQRLRSRVEIAADYYADHVFARATFGDLKGKGRPYLILNGTDASTGARFEFTQEQFDLLCADLDTFSLARGVAASSAFPGLLNSMTIDSYNGVPDAQGVNGCGYREPTWVQLGIDGQTLNSPRFVAAQQLRAYREEQRRHLHVLDGGLGDNIGLRSVLRSIASTDRPTMREGSAPPMEGGWSLLSLVNQRRVKTIVVVTVNARAQDRPDWDTRATGPGTPAVIGAAAGIPMGNYSNETLELLRTYGNEGLARLNQPGRPRFFGVEVTFSNIRDAGVRRYFEGIGTNFELTKTEVDCLVDRGPRLLVDSSSMTDRRSDDEDPQSFKDFVRQHLLGTIGQPDVLPVGSCSVDTPAARTARPHHLDIGGQVDYVWGASDEVEDRKGLGLAVRLARPDGFGVGFAYNRMAFRIPGRVVGAVPTLGDVKLHTLTAGLLYTRHAGPLEASAELHAGYGLGGADLRADAFRGLASGSSGVAGSPSAHSWIAMPGISLWYRLDNRWAVTASTMYTITRPTLRFDNAFGLSDRRLGIRTLSASVGLGFKLF